MKLKTTRAILLLAGLLAVGAAHAIGFNEVKDFGDVFRISGSAPTRDEVRIRWDIQDGYYLYNNQFLRVTSGTEGVEVGAPVVPPGEVSFDELLGEQVEKYHHELEITVPLTQVPDNVEAVQLKVRSQGCLENELCYPPTEQILVVSLPPAAAATSQPASPLSEPSSDHPSDSLSEPLSGGNLLGGQSDSALPAEEAFVYEAIGFDASTALIRFTAKPGYYLYVDKFHFQLVGDSGFAISTVDWPEGTVKDDPEFGPVSVYYGEAEVPVHFTRPAGPETEITLQAEFQGCRDGDICYPPMTRSVTFQMPAADAPVGQMGAAAATASGKAVTAKAEAPAKQVPVSDQDRLAHLLTSSPARAIVAFFLAGLLLAFTPCVFPMVPILSGIIVGQGDRLTTMRAFWLSLVYVLAMAVTYTVAGVLAGMFGQNLQAVFQNPWILSAFALIFVLLALSMFGFYELQLPGALQTRLADASNRQSGGALGGVAVMGFLSALIVGPCVAPPLMAALIVIGSSGDAVLGGAALFALAMGMGVPLIVFGVSAGKLVPRAGAWMDAVKAVFGVALLALALWMLERVLPGGLIMLLWGVLAIGSGVYLGALDRVEPGVSGWRRLWKSLGLVLLVLGVLEIVGAAAGGDYWLKPLEGIRQGTVAGAQPQHVSFTRIKSLDDLNSALASSGGRFTMLDFYADWCVECKRMERNTFPDPGVQAMLAEMRPLQADVTANDAQDQVLMKKFGIIGPPAILFFDPEGREMEAYRVVGYFTPDEFMDHLGRVIGQP